MPVKNPRKKYHTVDKPSFVLRHPDEPTRRKEFYFLNVGDAFPDFYGSKGLVVAKTASCISVSVDPAEHTAVEREIYDETLWQWIGQLISSGWKYECVSQDTKSEGEKNV